MACASDGHRTADIPALAQRSGLKSFAARSPASTSTVFTDQAPAVFGSSCQTNPTLLFNSYMHYTLKHVEVWSVVH